MYPDSYGTNRITLDQMKAKHAAKMHPEFARRFFAYIEAKGGLLGVGGGWRATGSQPDKSGFAPEGQSFHQDQTFASGTVGYSAVDLVTGNGSAKHKAPAWADTEDAGRWGLHTFINGEPWHIQCNEMRGWSTWRNAGRPDPHTIALPDRLTPATPSTPTPTPTPTPTEEDDNMLNATSLWRPKGYSNVFAVTPDGARHLGAETTEDLKRRLIAAGQNPKVIVSDHPQELKSVLALAGLTTADLVK
ncbi:hypothetical protein [Ilumatobacter sp.]|uniref:hypothetical protein n=1 Tax=Ilumatobacter sp. TaxID=1967498 RepID=UPI003750CD3F